MKRIVFISLAICSSLYFVACKNGNDRVKASDVVTNPNTADGSGDLQDLPVFEFETESHDFGKLREGEHVSYVFKFKNAGKRDLIISNQKTTCGCTVADYPKEPVKPGASGQITVAFNSEGKVGMNTKTVTLTANTQPNTKVLTIKAEVIK